MFFSNPENKKQEKKENFWKTSKNKTQLKIQFLKIPKKRGIHNKKENKTEKNEEKKKLVFENLKKYKTVKKAKKERKRQVNFRKTKNNTKIESGYSPNPRKKTNAQIEKAIF